MVLALLGAILPTTTASAQAPVSSAEVVRVLTDAAIVSAVEQAVLQGASSQRAPDQARRSDSVVNGALIGAGVAIAGGLFVCTRMEPWENCNDDFGPMVQLGAIGAGVGIVIDLLLRDKQTIVSRAPAATRLTAAPVVTGRSRGLQVALRF